MVTNKAILTTEVVLTDKQVIHITDERGKEFFDKYSPRFAEILVDPDYIFKSKNTEKDPSLIDKTAIAAKVFQDEGKVVNVVVSLSVEGMDISLKNSIITSIGIGEKRFSRMLRNNPPVYIKSLDNNE
ncbi:MAG: hypothetical protein II820_06060 [Ruminiclostridium sp.]|nr:hypothetical protein [Ruminiclostridium sp.]